MELLGFHSLMRPEKIINELRQLRFNGSTIVKSAFVREDLVHGQYSDQQADIQLYLCEGFYGKGGFDSGLNSVFLDPHPVSGAHGMDGVFLLREINYDRSPGIIHHAKLIDIVPTILHLMDIPMPTDLDGRSLARNNVKHIKPVTCSEFYQIS